MFLQIYDRFLTVLSIFVFIFMVYATKPFVLISKKEKKEKKINKQ